MPVTPLPATTLDPVASLVTALENATAALTATTNALTAGPYLLKASNLSDLTSASTARTSLGLGASAVMSTAQIAADSALTGTFVALSTITAAKTSAYTAAVGETVLCDPSTRTVTDGVTTSSSTTLTSATAAFTSTDVGKSVGGSGVVNGAVISTVVSSTQVTMSVNASASATGVTVGIGGPFTVTIPSSATTAGLPITVVKVDRGPNMVTLSGPIDGVSATPLPMLTTNRAAWSGRWDATASTWRTVTAPQEPLRPVRQWKAASQTTGTTFLTRLTSGHPFTVSSQGTGTVSLNDTTVPGPFSDRSIAITPGAGSGLDASCYAQTGAISVDLTGKSLLVWVKWDDTTSTTLEVKIGDAGLSNDYVWNIGRPGTWNAGYGGWTVHELFTTGPSGNTVGSPTIASLVKMRISTYKGGGPVHVGGVATRTLPTSTYANGAVLFTFDDGGLAAVSGQQKLGQYGYPGVAHIICGSVGTDPTNYMNLNQLRGLQAVGWEIAGHAMTIAGHEGGGGVGFTGLSTQQIHDEFAGQRTWLDRYGFPSTAWASPHGQCSPTVWGIGRNYFSLHRAAGGTVARLLANSQSAPFVRPEQIDTITFNASSAPVSTCNTAIDNTVSSGGVLALNFHGGTFGGSSSGETISAADFATIVDHANSAGISVVTFAQLQSDLTAYAY